LHRATATQLSEGMVIKGAAKYQRVAKLSTPRDSH